MLLEEKGAGLHTQKVLCIYCVLNKSAIWYRMGVFILLEYFIACLTYFGFYRHALIVKAYPDYNHFSL